MSSRLRLPRRTAPCDVVVRLLVHSDLQQIVYEITTTIIRSLNIWIVFIETSNQNVSYVERQSGKFPVQAVAVMICCATIFLSMTVAVMICCARRRAVSGRCATRPSCRTTAMSHLSHPATIVRPTVVASSSCRR